jgi:hypothetical protein
MLIFCRVSRINGKTQSNKLQQRQKARERKTHKNWQLTKLLHAEGQRWAVDGNQRPWFMHMRLIDNTPRQQWADFAQ